MSFQDTDLLLIQGSSGTEKITFAQFKEQTVLNDTDTLLINNGTVTNKVTWSEIKGEIVADLAGTATIAPVTVAPSATITCVANASGGKSPYTFAYQWQSNDTDWGDISGATQSDYVVATGMVGRTLRCQVTVTDADGKEEVVLSNVSNTVEQSATAPIVGSVSLTEQTPGLPRFTDQKFDATVTMTDQGQPVSAKVFDAYVEGTITVQKQFDEPLESSTAGSLVFATGTDMSALAPGDEVRQDFATGGNYITEADPANRIDDVENLTDGKATTQAEATYAVTPILQTYEQVDIFIRPDGAAWDYTGSVYFWYNIISGLFKFEAFYEDNTTFDIEASQGNTGHRSSVFNTLGKKIKFIRLTPLNINSRIQVAGLQRNDNDEWFGDDGTGPLSYVGTVASRDGTTVTLTESVTGWVDGTNVTGPDKTVVTDNAKKHLKFDSNGNVSDLLDAPQDPAYETSDENASLTLTFPSAFLSGQAPDDELGTNTTLTVSVTAKNLAGESGPVTKTIQPETTIQFREPLDSSGTTVSGTVYSDAANWSGDGWLSNPEVSRTIPFMAGTAGLPWVANSPGATMKWTAPDSTEFQNLEGIRFYLKGSGTTPGTFIVNGQSYSANTGTGESYGTTGKWYIPSGQVSLTSFEFGRYSNTGQLVVTAVQIIRNQGDTWTQIVDASDVTTLTFASGADMRGLADGDEVTQDNTGTDDQPKWSDGVQTSGGENANTYFQNPENLYDGDINTFTAPGQQLFSGTTRKFFEMNPGVQVNEKVEVTMQVTQGNATVNMSGIPFTNPAMTFTSSDGKATKEFAYTGELRTLELTTAGTFTDPQIYQIKVDGNILIDNGDPLPNITTGTVASLDGTTVTLTEEVSGWVNGVDVVGPQKTNIRSMSQEEMVEQKAKFFTYENRRDVHQGQQAMAERLEIARQLQAAGVDPPAINELFGGTES